MKYRRILKYFIPASIVLLILFTALQLVVTISLKMRDAENLVTSIRNYQLTGNDKEAFKILEMRLGPKNSFAAISILDEGTNPVFLNDSYNENSSRLVDRLWISHGRITIPVYFDDDIVFRKIEFYFSLWDNLSYLSGLYLLSVLILFFVIKHVLKVEARRSIEHSNLVKYRAVAQTTQMLAHDVRKPFNMMESLIELVGDMTDPIAIRDTMKENLPSVSYAITSVNGMIQDVMEIGTDSKITAEPIGAAEYTHQILRNIFQFKAGLQIDLTYDIPTYLCLNIDGIKFSRVFGNIVGNAIEHMKGRGRIWFCATKPKEGFSTYTIGNSGTYILREDIDRLFEAFFTKDKAGGTGLGLAIAKKIVEAHGGKIWCQSSISMGTEFIFTVPASISETTNSLTLPSKSSEFFIQRETLNTRKTLGKRNSKSQSFVSNAAIPLKLPKINQTDKILLFEDEPIFQRRWKNLAKPTEVIAVSSWKEFISGFPQFDWNQIAFVVMDLHLADNENGLDAAAKIKTFSPNLNIYLSSNADDVEDPRGVFAAVVGKDPKSALAKISNLNREN